MKLDDNTRAALHYLTLGVVVLFLFMLVDRCISDFSTASDPRLAIFAMFQHGYFVGDGLVIVDASSTRGERFAWALVVAVGAAVITGFAAHWLSHGNRTWTLGCARLVLVLSLGWGIYSALFLAPRIARFTTDRGEWTIITRPNLSVGMVLPIPPSETVRKFDRIDTVGISEAATDARRRIDLVLWCKYEGDTIILSTLTTRGTDHHDELEDSREMAHHSARVLQSYFHQP